VTRLEVLAAGAVAVFMAGVGAGYWWMRLKPSRKFLELWYWRSMDEAHEDGYEEGYEDARKDLAESLDVQLMGHRFGDEPYQDPPGPGESDAPESRGVHSEPGQSVRPGPGVIRDEDDPHYWYPGNQALLRHEARPRTVIDWSVLPVLERVTLETWDWARRLEAKMADPAWPSRDDLARLDAQVRELVAG
jgi:hypothetical protein